MYVYNSSLHIENIYYLLIIIFCFYGVVTKSKDSKCLEEISKYFKKYKLLY